VPQASAPPIMPQLPAGPKPAMEMVSVEKAKVTFDYKAEQDDELNLSTGEVITILDKNVFEGWWRGELDGKEGIFPNNFVQLLPKEEEPAGSLKVTTKLSSKPSIRRAAKELPSSPMDGGKGLFPPGGIGPGMLKKAGSDPKKGAPPPPSKSSKPKPALPGMPTAPKPGKPALRSVKTENNSVEQDDEPEMPKFKPPKPKDDNPAKEELPPPPLEKSAPKSPSFKSTQNELNSIFGKPRSGDSLPRKATPDVSAGEAGDSERRGSIGPKRPSAPKGEQSELEKRLASKREEAASTADDLVLDNVDGEPSIDLDTVMKPVAPLGHVNRVKAPGKNLPKKYQNRTNRTSSDDAVDAEPVVKEEKPKVCSSN